MAYEYSELLAQTRTWAEQACAAGWLDHAAAAPLTEPPPRTPDSLFGQHTSRPLIVAFMGGSGVGKSTLLNRLAGKPIAQAGIERPTSREVTLFHHHSLALQQLPEQFPIAQVNSAQHDDEAKKNIIWIDMPDFDSVEQGNRQLVLQWLPHIDVLVYVVSPERYRDEKAWQLLLAEGSRHAWLFVMNQWDRGLQEQAEDFRQQLHKAGFYEPVLFKTACTEHFQTDEFATLEETINSLANSHTIAQLELRGQHLRTQELRQKLHQIKEKLGQPQGFTQLRQHWQNQWPRTTEVLRQGFAWPLQAMAGFYAEHAADLLVNAQNHNASLWDTWAQARFTDALDELMINAHQLNLPIPPLRKALQAVRGKAEKTVRCQTELSVRKALVKPGNGIQRGFLKLVRFCEITLPLAAMAWVSYQVLLGYYQGTQVNSRYLGVDFAIHSGLLIVLTWLLPFFILKKAQPSLKKSALRGLNKGLEQALSSLDAELTETLDSLAHQHQEQNLKLEQLIAQCTQAHDPLAKVATRANPTLNRMLMD